MDIQGECRIPVERDRVWLALNDVEVLRRCFPGCESLEKESDTELSANLRMKIGPVKANFATHVTLSDLDPPCGYTISGEGKGGAAGFGRGSTTVRLEAHGDETLLSYTAGFQVGGRIAQVGSRLLAGTARKIADDFFSRFTEVLVGEAPPVA